MLGLLGRVGRPGLSGGGSLNAPLDLNLLRGPLDPRITFTRASTATYFDNTGTMQTAASGAPRFDNDPSTLSPRGLLIEESRTNNVPTANIDAGTAWPVQNLTTTINATTAPDGTNTAALIVDNVTNAQHSTQTTANFSYVTGTTYVFSIFAKAASAHVLQIYTGSAAFSSPPYANFDLAAGTVGTVVGGTSFIQNCGNGWYRCTLVGTATLTGSTVCLALALVNNNTNATRALNYAGSGTGVYVWGGQMEAGGFVTSFIPTTTVAVTRAAESANLAFPGTVFTTGNGSLAYEYSYPASAAPANQFHWSLEDVGTGSNQLAIYQNAGGTQAAILNRTGGTTRWNTNLGSVSPGTIAKEAVAWNATNVFTQEGASANSNANPAAPASYNTLLLGRQNSGSFMNGYIRRVRYWPRALSATELRQVCA